MKIKKQGTQTRKNGKQWKPKRWKANQTKTTKENQETESQETQKDSFTSSNWCSSGNIGSNSFTNYWRRWRRRWKTTVTNLKRLLQKLYLNLSHSVIAFATFLTNRKRQLLQCRGREWGVYCIHRTVVENKLSGLSLNSLVNVSLVNCFVHSDDV